MTRGEVIDLLEILAGAYPNVRIRDPERMVDAWMLAFGKEDAGVVYRSARHHLQTCKYFPTIADINKSMKYSFMYIRDDQVDKLEDKNKAQVVQLLPESSGEYLDFMEELGFHLGDDS